MTNHQTPMGYREFVSLMALLMSLTALTIDTMLPVLAQIGAHFGVTDPNDNQLVISTVFLGLAIGQVFYGPLSDSIGRKPAIYIGTGIFVVGCFVSLFATTFFAMLVGRLLQGLGIAGARIVSVAQIRDKYSGRAMAQVMSFVMALFILVPVVAPALGQAIVSVSHWRAIFALFLLLSTLSVVWLAARLPETLAPERRTPLSPGNVIKAVREVCSIRIALGYTLVAGFVSGLFLAFLGTAQQILQIQYGLGDQFPLYFAVIALSIGVASFINGRLVLRFGMRRLSSWALYLFCSATFLYLIFAGSFGGQPPLWTYITYLLLVFFCIGILFGNINSLAMQPLGHIAGVGAAVVGSLSTFISLPLGIYIGQRYDGTVLPLIVGFLVCSLLAVFAMHWAENKLPWRVNS